jgi:DNA-binding transcriptional ArsR family regulator
MVNVKKASSILRAVNHNLRQEMIKFVMDNGNRITVTEIYTALKMEQSVCSQQLRTLRLAGILFVERKGKFVYYSVNKERMENIDKFCASLLIFSV